MSVNDDVGLSPASNGVQAIAKVGLMLEPYRWAKPGRRECINVSHLNIEIKTVIKAIELW